MKIFSILTFSGKGYPVVNMDYQQLIDEMLGAVDQPELPLDQLRAMAQSYADACTEVNRRLARCGQYLRAGNSAEAIRLADTTPSLLEMCNTLDFAEREDWADLCKSLHLPSAPVIVRQNFEQLNNAYNLFRPMDELLKENRRLALEKAPLKERIAVLKKLNDLEPQNIIWTEMIEEFEKFRIEEIQREFPDAQRQQNAYQIIYGYLIELETTDWKAQPPAKLVQDITVWIRNSKAKLSLIQFKKIALKLSKLMEEDNYEQAQDLQMQWADCLRTYGVAYSQIPIDVRRQYEQTVNWMQNKKNQIAIDKQFEMKIVRFKQTLHTSISTDQLIMAYESLENELLDANRMMPKDIENEYLSILDEYKKRIWRKQKIYIILISVFIALFAILIIFFAVYYKKNNHINKELSDVSLILEDYRKFVEEGEGQNSGAITQAETAMERLKEDYPHVTSSSNYQALTILGQDLKKKNRQRIEKFEKAAQNAEDSLLNENAIFPDWTALEEAKSNARLDTEKERVTDLDEKFNKMVAMKKNMIKKKIEHDFADIDLRIDKIQLDQRSTPEVLVSQARAINTEIEELGNYTRQIDGIEARKKSLMEKNQKLITILEEDIKLREEVRPLVESVGNHNLFNRALSTYIKENPQSLIARNYTNIRDSISGYNKIKLWNSFVIENGDLYLEYGNRNTFSKKFRTNLDKLKNENCIVPEINEVEEKIKDFDELVTYGGREEVARKLQEFLKEFGIPPLWVCYQKTPDKSNYYYFTKNTSSGVLLSYGKAGVLKDDPFKQAIPDSELQNSTPAPHSIAINDFLTKIDIFCYDSDYSMGRWYSELAKLLENFNPYKRTSPELDPIVKIFFFKKFDQILRKDPFCDKVLHPSAQIFMTPLIQDDLDWYNPDAPDIQKQRELIQRYFNDLPSKENDNIAEEFTSVLNDFVKPMSVTYEWIGFLSCDRYECGLMAHIVPESGELFICHKKDAKSNVYTLEKIGVCEDSIVKFDESIIKLNAEQSVKTLAGLPVFYRKVEPPNLKQFDATENSNE